jgi:tetratricopeptide (TPR) repeat protein
LRLGDNNIKLAHSDFRACFQSLPGEISCHLALVYTLLEMDRVQEARQHLDLRSEQLAGREETVLMSAWVSLAEQSATPESLLASWTEKLERPEVNPLVRQLVGQLEGRAGDSSRAEVLLVQAARELWESPDPFLRRNVARAYASAARFGVSDSRAQYVEEALLLGSADPLVLVELALYFEAQGESRKAAEHMDLAATLGLESALAQYARGLYYLDRGQMRDRTRQSWRRYRQLRPSGPRIEQVENWLVELR